jgi:hypothetical protein
MRLKTYHGLARMRRAIEDEMRIAEERRGSGDPETQRLYRAAADIRKAELQYIGPAWRCPVIAPIRRNDAA